MNEWLGDLPLWLVAENGLYIRAPGAPGEQPPPWEMTMREELDDTWMEQVRLPQPKPNPNPNPNPDPNPNPNPNPTLNLTPTLRRARRSYYPLEAASPT